MSERIVKAEFFPLAIPRDEPYLGPLEAGVEPNSKGYFIRPGNHSIYSLDDHSVLVKLTSSVGAAGWGECVTVVAPRVVCAVLDELLLPLVIGRSCDQVAILYQDLYDTMRVRGFFGGFFHDAIAAIDIAMWDLAGKLAGKPVCELLGGARRTRIPAYVSGLPGRTQADRMEKAKRFLKEGFNAFKFAAAVAHEGEYSELSALRDAIGPKPDVLIDFHWKYTSGEAIRRISQLEPLGLCVAEAPVPPEDIEGQARVAEAIHTPVAIGEELRTVYEYAPRFQRHCMDVIQPEAGRAGITAFQDICRMAEAFHCAVMPHASIGIGIFQAASLHCAATVKNLPYHEYQHSIFDRNLRFVTGDMNCRAGFFSVPSGAGLGVEPRPDVFEYVQTAFGAARCAAR
jgi:galactonate dehydratase